MKKHWCLSLGIASFLFPMTQAMAETSILCKIPASPHALFTDVAISLGATNTDPVALQFTRDIIFTGSYSRQATNDGAVQTIAVQGQIPANLAGTTQPRFGSLNYVADVTPHFAALPNDTKILVEISRPETPQTSFSGMVTVWASFSDGKRSMLCQNTADTCLPAYEPLNCEIR